MSARYYVLIDAELVRTADWDAVRGFRLIENHCPEPGQPEMDWWLCEDDDAPESLDGKRVEPAFQRDVKGASVTWSVIARRPA